MKAGLMAANIWTESGIHKDGAPGWERLLQCSGYKGNAAASARIRWACSES